MTCNENTRSFCGVFSVCGSASFIAIIAWFLLEHASSLLADHVIFAALTTLYALTIPCVCTFIPMTPCRAVSHTLLLTAFVGWAAAYRLCVLVATRVSNASACQFPTDIARFERLAHDYTIVVGLLVALVGARALSLFAQSRSKRADDDAQPSTEMTTPRRHRGSVRSPKNRVEKV